MKRVVELKAAVYNRGSLGGSLKVLIFLCAAVFSVPAQAYQFFQPAINVLGQADFSGSQANRGGAPSASTLSDPNGLWTDGTRLAVADKSNHRVLLFNSIPASAGAAADVVLGQADFVSNLPNRGLTPSASSLYNPTGVFFDGTRFYVADKYNNRVLIYPGWPSVNGSAATVVVGQADFVSTLYNRGGAVAANTLGSPTDMVSDGSILYVADGNNRVLVFSSIPATNGPAANFALGQGAMNTSFNIATALYTTNGSGQMALSGNRLYICSYSDHRVEVYAHPVTTTSVTALYILGQLTDTTFYASEGNCDHSFGGFDTPAGVASDGSRVLVGDRYGVSVYAPIPSNSVQPACQLGFVSASTQVSLPVNDRYVGQVNGLAAWSGGVLVSTSQHRILQFSPSTVIPAATPTEAPVALSGPAPFVRSNPSVALPYRHSGYDELDWWRPIGSAVYGGGEGKVDDPTYERASASAWDASSGALLWRSVPMPVNGTKPSSSLEGFDADSSGAYLYWRDLAYCGGTSDQYRLTKFDLLSGAPVGAFGTAGTLALPSAYAAYDLKALGGDLYFYGSGAGLIERRSESSGALDASFGTGGIVAPSSDVADDLILDGSDLYAITEWFPSAGDRAWRLEKRSAASGALDASFGAGGMVSSNPGPAYDRPLAVACDATDVYVLGFVNSTPARWRLEKRSKSSGALDPAFGSGGAVEVAYNMDWDGLVLSPSEVIVTGYGTSSGYEGVWMLAKADGSFTHGSSAGIFAWPWGTELRQPQWMGSLVGAMGQGIHTPSDVGVFGYKFDPATLQPLPTATPTSPPGGSPSSGPLAPIRPGKIYNYPNPLRPGGGRTTVFRFQPTSNAKLEFYDVAGRKVGELDASKINGGAGTAVWDGRLYNDAIAAPGLYMVLLRGDNGILSAKLTVIR